MDAVVGEFSMEGVDELLQDFSKKGNNVKAELEAG